MLYRITHSTSKVQNCGRALKVERSNRRSSVFFLQLGPSPLHPPCVHLTSIHVISIPRPSPLFAALPLSCIIPNANQSTKNGGDLGTRLVNITQNHSLVQKKASGGCLYQWTLTQGITMIVAHNMFTHNEQGRRNKIAINPHMLKREKRSTISVCR